MGQDNGQYWDHEAGAQAQASETRSQVLPTAAAQAPVPAFDGYDLLDVPLGDLMRGERATLGKSLLDVERELRIRATYIAAIENGDVGAFQSQGFIAGYVRSYARYLGIDPEWTFRRFCDETGFRGIHGGATNQASDVKRTVSSAPRRLDPNEVMASSRISYAPTSNSLFSRIEPGALGSVAVLLVLAVGIGYGAWAILNDIQRLQIAPIDEAPAVPLAQLDPLVGVETGAGPGSGTFGADQTFDIAMPGPEAGNTLFRPQALEAPVLTPRDGALASLNPDEVGTFAGSSTAVTASAAPAANAPAAPASNTAVQVTAGRADEVMIFATRPTWVRVTSADGATIYEATLNAGDSYVVPATDSAPRLRSGNAGSLYFAVNGVALGPAGPGATIVRDVELTADAVTATYEIADTEADPDLTQVASLMFDAASVPDIAPVVPQAPVTAYNPTDPAPQPLTLFPEIPADVAAAIIASNALPVTVQTPTDDDLRPIPRP
ncbi:helix-turn-helix domain-containing protein [Gymnodinialimonas sp.]